MSSSTKELAFGTITYTGDSMYAYCNGIEPGKSIRKTLNVDVLSEPDTSTMQVNVPQTTGGSLYSREFMIAANIKSAVPYLDLKIIDPENLDAGMHELPVFSNGHRGVKVRTNTWTTV